MKIYTKTGDKGTTSLYTGERVPKDSIRVEAYGIIDEFDSALGLSRAFCRNKDVCATIYDIQKLLWKIMAEVASVGEMKIQLSAADVQNVEQVIDKFDAQLPPLAHFLIPGDHPGSAALDMARTVARRAERELWRLAHVESLNDNVLIIINRLSDLCFVLARVENEIQG
jgi:cob(I)alamin adenosyltransferase